MKRKIVQDVIPPKEGRSIRNIPIPQRVSKNETSEIESRVNNNVIRQEAVIGEDVSTQNRKKNIEVTTIPAVEKKNFSGKLKFVFFILGTAIVFGGGYFIYLFFNIGAVVTVTPKEKEIYVDNSFVSKKTAKEGELNFEVISLVETMEKAVPTTGEKKVDKKARGEIVVYNDYSTQSQRLIKNTRFETPEGLIFKSESSIVVPGQTKKDGKSTPGSVGVVVVADESGEKYNVDLKDFTIPGFKNEPEYEKFYARSKTAMTGGFSGIIKTASPTDIEIARKELTVVLKEKVQKAVSEKVPAGFILFDNAFFTSFETLSNPEDSNVSMKVLANAIIFNKDNLAKILAGLKIDDYRGENITSNVLDKMSLKVDPKEATPWITGVFPVTFTGTTTLTWNIDTGKLRKDLVGVPKNFVNDIFKNYIGIDKAEVALTPTWKSVFPEDEGKIEIKIKPSLE